MILSNLLILDFLKGLFRYMMGNPILLDLTVLREQFTTPPQKLLKEIILKTVMCGL